MRKKADEHRRGVKNQVAEERPDAADDKRGKGVEDEGSKANYDIVEIKMTAGDVDAEGAEHNVHGGENRDVTYLFCSKIHVFFLIF